MADIDPTLSDLAASMIEECGENARMGALFLARELREEGDDDAALVWSRVADMIPAIEAMRQAKQRH